MSLSQPEGGEVSQEIPYGDLDLSLWKYYQGVDEVEQD